MRLLYLAVLLASSVCFAQTTQPPATTDELKYLRFMLLNVASLDHDPVAIKAFEDLLVKQFGLDTQESAIIRAHGLTLKQLLARGDTATRRRKPGHILAAAVKNN